MPPWKPDVTTGIEFVGARRLREAEIATLQRWVDTGAVEGNPADLPALPVYPDGWRLGEPDLIVAMPEAYVLEPGASDILRNVVIPIEIPSTRYVRGLEFRPDNARVVHHANIRVDRTRSARSLDAADTSTGFDGRLSGAAAFPDGQFLGWTPGQLSPLLSDDTTWRLDPGSDLVVQLHLRPTERREQVRVRIGLFFADRAPTRTPVMLRLGRQDIDIPSGASDYRVTDTYRLAVDVDVLAVQPHAHVRAREVRGRAMLPDGSVRELLHIADWDFDWQDQYRYAVPVPLPRGSQLEVMFRYDNSAANRRNPDRPPRRVRWGQDTRDEMGDLWFQVTTADDDARRRLLRDFGPKVLAEDAVGYESLLQSDPDNPRLHEAAAALQLALGQVDRGIAHLNTALSLDPRSVEAHYNLATARAWQGQSDAAVDHFSRALALSPGHVAAHVNLAAVLRTRGDDDDAVVHLRLALASDPQNAAAHTSLGAILMRQRRVTDAIAEYRAALQSAPDLLEPLTELAWTLATSPDARIRNDRDAIALAEHARALTGGRDPRALDALAAAYASAGRYQDAIQALEPAIPGVEVVAPEAGRLLRERLALYAQQQPYRDESRQDR